jgi:hypothetical protein
MNTIGMHLYHLKNSYFPYKEDKGDLALPPPFDCSLNVLSSSFANLSIAGVGKQRVTRTPSSPFLVLYGI